MKEEFEKIFSSESLNMSVYNQIMIVFDDNFYHQMVGGKSTGEAIRKIADEEGFGVVVDCLVSILLDKSKKEYWDKVMLGIWESFLIFDFLESHPNKDKLVAICWYCLELNPKMDSLVYSVANRLKHPDKLISDPYEYSNYPRTHPDVVKELNKLKNIYGST